MLIPTLTDEEADKFLRDRAFFGLQKRLPRGTRVQTKHGKGSVFHWRITDHGALQVLVSYDELLSIDPGCDENWYFEWEISKV